jgi:hypothetical protein
VVVVVLRAQAARNVKISSAVRAAQAVLPRSLKAMALAKDARAVGTENAVLKAKATTEALGDTHGCPSS